MKHLTRIFLAVAILFAGFACTTDATEDLGVNGFGQTTITLSLEGSRTQLGEKVGDLYPVYWSEGDQISVNGVASNALTAEQAGSSVAAFTVSGTHDTYNIAYPAAEANQVLFAASQAHTSNTTFASGAATLYGVGSAEQGVELHHLTGVLKIGVTGAATLKKAQISTIDNAPIAGAFDIDFTNGEVTPSATAKTVVNYSFGEGVALSSEPTFIHVAVPAGVYNELYVTLFDNNDGVMYATVKADNNKPLTAGNVRSFSKHIEFAPINSATHIISEAADLVKFASEAATSTKDVVFVADVDMSEVEWTPIEGYAGTINGNGYAIKGLKAPLFGSTNAKIKGLHLKGVDQEWTTLTHGGLFACDMNEGGMLSHCSAEGKVLINNTTYAESPKRAQYEFIYGGLVGYAAGATIEHCENKANITVSAICAESVSTLSTHLYGLSLGGIVGAAEILEGGSATSITNVVNRGDIYLANTTPLSRGYHWIGGVFGQTINNNSISAFHHCTNHGKIHTVRDSKIAAIRAGGVFGDIAENENIGSCSFLHNYGDIDLHGTLANGVPHAYGIGYTLGSSEVKADDTNDQLNQGNITVQTNGSGDMYVCGGILGVYCNNVSYRVKNEGNITIKPYDETTTVTGSIYALGLSNNLYTAISGTTDNPSGNSGAINVSGTCGAAVYVTGGATNVRGNYTDVTNSGDITVSATAGTDVAVYGVGRLVYNKMTNVHNTGNITFSGTSTAGTIQIAGVCGALGNYAHNTDKSKPSSNSGTIKCTGKALASGKTTKVAGYAVILNYKNGTSEILNTGSVICEATAESVAPIYVGGLACDINYFVNDSENKGSVTISGNVAAKSFVAGIGTTVKGKFTNVTNSGTISSTATHTQAVRLGGIIGDSFSGAEMVGVRNSGDVILDGQATNSIGVGGFWAVNQTAETTFTDCHNNGYICVKSTGTNASSNNIAGLVGYTSKNLTFDGCSNSNNSEGKGIYVDQTVNHGYFDIAGAVGYVYKAKITFLNGFTNSADIHAKVKKTYKSTYPVGGVLAIYNLANASYDDWTGTIKNSGNITFEGECTQAGETLGVGGIVGVSGSQACEANLVNTGNLTIKAVEGATYPTTYGFGGIFGIAAGSIKNAESYLVVDDKVGINIGWITGSARVNGTVVATNCKVGGGFVKQDDEDEATTVDTMSADNFHEYIYGSGGSTDWTGTDNHDGCSLLTAKPE